MFRSVYVLLTATGLMLLDAQHRSTDVIVQGGWLFDGVRDDVRRNTGIVMRNGVFVQIDAHVDSRAARNARIITLADDEYVLPGLFDLHAHYAVDVFGDGSGEGRVDEYTVNPLLFLANGVTSTFTADELDPEGLMQARNRIDGGAQIGPRILNSGPYFGTARAGWKNAEITPERIRDDVRMWAAAGVKGFKAKGITAEHLLVLIEEAHRHGLTVTGHLGSGFQNTVNPRDAVAMGIDRVEHFMGGDAITPDKGAYDSLQHLDATSPAVTAIFKTYIEQQVYFDATLSIFGAISREPKELYEYWVNEMEFLTPYARSVVAAKLPRPPFVLASRLFRAKLKEVKGFYDAGGRHLITLGTDCASWGEYLCGFAVHRELQALVLAGIPPAHALKTGTINSARALNLGAKLGTIEPGRFADLFVVRGNPLKDIRHTRDIRWVIKAGDVYDPNTLLASAKGKMGPMGEEDSARWKGRGALPTPGRGSRPSGASPFEGTWNLDVSQSRSQQPIPNAVLTIRSIPEGFEWRFERVTAEGKATPRIAMCHLDGKEHALSISDGRHQRHTSTCRQLEERTLEHVINHDAGKMVTTTRTVVSRDGQTLREVWRGHNEKGEKIDLVYVYDKQQ